MWYTTWQDWTGVILWSVCIFGAGFVYGKVVRNLWDSKDDDQ